jgi:formate dehydrogenase subunit gamma
MTGPQGVPAGAGEAAALPLDARQLAVVRQALDAHAGRLGALLPILHAIQAELRFVPAAAVPLVAERLNLSRAEVHGVISFYHDFRARAPAGRVIKLCRAEACQAVGAVALEAHVRRVLAIGEDGSSADGHYTLEPAYCLGNCACGPSLLVEDELHARVTPQRFDALVAEAKP